MIKWALVGDLQIPYHDRRAVALFMKAMKSWRPDAIDVVGDIDDQLEYSRFSDGTTDEFLNKLLKDKKQTIILPSGEEREETDEEFRRRISPIPFVKENAQGAREFYAALRKQHKKADIHASLGNHDIRAFAYADRKFPEYVEQLTPELLWGLDSQGITWNLYDETPLKRFGDIHVHHGKTTTTTGLAVKGDIETYNISLARGHDHRGGLVFKSYPMTGTTLVGLGTGHLCDPAAYGLRYTINHAWELGFGIGYVIGDKVILQFVPIINTDQGLACVIDGKVITE